MEGGSEGGSKAGKDGGRKAEVHLQRSRPLGHIPGSASCSPYGSVRRAQIQLG